MRCVGTCSRCGGPVCVPSVWMSVLPPTPQCRSCNATPKAAFGPVIEMDEPSRSVNVDSIKTLNELAKLFQ